MHVVLLRAALALYSVGLLHSVLTILNRKHTLFRVSLFSIIAGFICHTTSIVVRAMELQYMPLTQRPDAVSFFAALGALGFLVAYAKYRITSLSVFVFPVIFILTFIANLVYDSSNSIPPALLSNWIYIHTPLIFLGYAALFISFGGAIMYLIRERELKSKHPSSFYHSLPSLEICDDLSYRSLAIGFPLITLGLLSGAVWAQSIWGTVWGGDLKILL